MTLISIRRVLASALVVCALSVVSFAQGGAPAPAERAPAEPLRPFVVLTAQSLSDLERRVRAENRAEDLMGGPGTQLRVAVLNEKDKAASEAEVHDASDDVYYVLEGSATLTLGGKLHAPHETEPGEWRAARIAGGRTFEIRKGDLVVVPRGTPHARSTAGKDFSMILIKVWAVPLPDAQPKPAPAATEKKP